jgi:predicted PolB exonuclease-like 3'-5' exonuclease
MSFLIFDIETVPDLSLWTPPPIEAPPAEAPLPGQLGLPGAPAPGLQSVPMPPTAVPATSTMTAPGTPAPGFSITIPPAGQRKARKPRARKPKAGEQAKEPFAPLYAHRVIAIGWVWLELDAGQAAIKGLGCVGTSTFKDDEPALLTAWNEFVRREQPTVVSFAGRTFDVPVLGLRAMRHGISQSWADEGYRKRYGDHHVDLFDVLTEYGALPRTGYSLGTLSTVLGLPDKGELSGGSVQAMYSQGQIAKIEAYCCSDAVRAAFLLLRYRLMRGWTSVEQYRVGARALLEKCAAMNLGNLTLGVDTRRLLLEG